MRLSKAIMSTLVIISLVNLSSFQLSIEKSTIENFNKNTKIYSNKPNNLNFRNRSFFKYIKKDLDITESPLNIKSTAKNINYNIINDGLSENISNLNTMFPTIYSYIDGILTFRGNNLRNSPSFGVSSIRKKQLKQTWSFNTSSGTWGGGAGWTGQPSIIKWPNDIKNIMNLDEKSKSKDDFIEVIYASLDGNIHFMDLKSGEKTRPSISINNPIKGSVSIDPRGYPLLYVGQGIPETGRIGYRIFSLINGKELFFLKGLDKDAFRAWGAFDGSPLINRLSDTMILGGENGIFYKIKLNTIFDINKKNINITPRVTKYTYKIKNNQYEGIENSPAVYKNLAYFADNGGWIQCLDLETMEPVWTFDNNDDTDATLTLEIIDDVPYIYTGNEVDKQGTTGTAYIRKLNGLTGEVIFEKPYNAMSLLGEHPVNGGILGTNIIGKNSINNLVIFTIARYNGFNSGLLVALDKNTGEEIWRFEMKNYAWSSPVDFYDKDGNAYIIQCDSKGNMYLLDGKSGTILDVINLGSNIESSPAIYKDTIVVATRWGKIYGIQIF